jgi:ArsR family transcriptional regulator, arsenate/arsenite/antimonite-responsive transcriptional repressor
MVSLERKLKALGDPARFKILNLLPKSDNCCEKLFNVSYLSVELSIPQPTVSHHLNILKNVGLVNSKKTCRDVYYWVNKEEVQNIIEEIKQII